MYVKLRYRFRFYPTKPQQATLANVFGACRYVYNWGLRMRTDAFHAGAPIGYNQSSAKLTELRHTKETRWLESVSIVPIQQSLRHLNIAFLNFFEKRSAYPSFKKKRGKQCAEYTRSAFRWRGSARTITLSQLGALDIRWSREFASEPSTVTITKTPSGRYFATLVLDETPKRLPLCKEEAGIDLGINRLATLSNGERIANPRHLGLRLRQLKHASRCLSRRTKGSGRWQRQRLRVARLQERIADSRADHLHKVTTDLVRRFGTLYIEDLNVRGMVRNHCLARSLSDASFGMFRSMLAYKCAWYGRELVEVDRFFPSSKRCSKCGHILESLALSVRSWRCPECGAAHDRDLNAALNIRAAGHAVRKARGEAVRRIRSAERKRRLRRNVNRLGNRASHGS